jgi:hypothetical protein
VALVRSMISGVLNRYTLSHVKEPMLCNGGRTSGGPPQKAANLPRVR